MKIEITNPKIKIALIVVATMIIIAIIGGIYYLLTPKGDELDKMEDEIIENILTQ